MYETPECKKNVTQIYGIERPDNDRVILDVLNYWESLRKGRVAPRRSEIDPREIISALGHSFILELDRVGGARFRLAGMKVCDLLGMELRGMPARSVIDPAFRNGFEDTLRTLADRPEVIEYRLNGVGQGQFGVAARMLLLPMRGTDGKISRILGAISVRSPLVDPPLRFEIVEKLTTRIVTGAPDARAPLAGFAEPAEEFQSLSVSVERDAIAGKPLADSPEQQPTSRGKPYLRLVHSR